MDLEKLIKAFTDLAEVLEGNPAAGSLIDLILYTVIAVFTYSFVSMIFDKFKESRTEKLLDKIDGTLRENVMALGKVATALEQRGD